MSQDARLDEEKNTQRRAQILNLQYFDTYKNPIRQTYKELLTNQELYGFKVVPLQKDEHFIKFGVVNSTSQQTMHSLRMRFTDHQVSFALISETGYREYMHVYDPPKKVEYHDINITSQEADQVNKVSQILDQVKADDMLAYLVKQAHQLGASDIHVEPQRGNARIRFRVDGVLHKIADLTPDKYRMLISAIASAGDVSTASSEAQQGHIAQRVTMAEGSVVDINVRLETVPSINGMEVVMRLFNMDKDMYTLDRLGLSVAERKVVDEIIAKPSGLVMVVGPTGSGKTTTLYSILNTLNTPDRKIVTIEDPVEYQFEGISQISITSKSSKESNFAEKLRATLRMDPNIMMVGEIRDSDTAKTALQAALTGHLVLSTFHAGTASAAITRLIEMIGYNPLFVSSIRLIMAQRLVRKLDDESKQAYSPDMETLKYIAGIVGSLPEGIERPDLANLQLYKPAPSDNNPFGFKGQIALREQFLMTSELGALLGSTKNITSQQIEEVAVKGGMRTILQDGILKVIAGETTLEEVYRVVD